ncbi:MAG: TolC family outer membrane protein [Devosia sp.]
MNKRLIHILSLGVAAAAIVASSASAMSLRDSIQIALESNPEVGQAAESRQAIEFELRQAVGLYAPRIDLEASAGVQALSNPSRRAAGIADDMLLPAQVGLVATFDLLDGGFRDSETAHQAARVDGASFRVLERSEFIALQIARVYYQVLLQQQIVALSSDNVSFHQAMLNDVGSAIDSGQLTEADRFQAIERLAAARARLTEAGVELEAARIEFELYVGVRPSNATMPPRIGGAMPNSLEAAIGMARLANPRVLLADSDIDAAAALVDQSRSGLAPKLQLEMRAATGLDTGGTAGWNSDLSARLSLRWNLYDGGVKSAEVQESLHRESEAMLALDQTYREVEEAVRTSWLRLQTQGELSRVYQDQLNSSSDLVSSYREQLNVGDRSLLDVLDAQNTRYNVQVLQETARYSVYFAEYRLMASCGLLLQHYGLSAPSQADAYARAAFETPSWEDSEPEARQPLDLTSFIN